MTRPAAKVVPMALALPVLAVPVLESHGDPTPSPRTTGHTAQHASRGAGNASTLSPHTARLHLSSEAPAHQVTRLHTDTVQLAASKRAKRGSVRAAKQYARSRLSTANWRALNRLAHRESRWNKYARNPSTGAYGIPQALPGRKMASAGPHWRHNAVTQVTWMIRYVNGRYGSAAKAWRFWRKNHWY